MRLCVRVDERPVRAAAAASPAVAKPTADGPMRKQEPAARHGTGAERARDGSSMISLAPHNSAVPRPRAFPVVLAGFSAFLDLYATQPLLPFLARTFHASSFARQPHRHRADDRGRARGADRRPARGSIRAATHDRRVGVRAGGRHGAGGDGRDAAAVDLLALRAGDCRRPAFSRSRSPTFTRSGRPRRPAAPRRRTSAARSSADSSAGRSRASLTTAMQLADVVRRARRR